MASSSTAAAQTALATWWTESPPAAFASGAQRSALITENWLPMATIAAEFRPMVYDLWLLQSLGSRGVLAAIGSANGSSTEVISANRLCGCSQSLGLA